MAGHEGMSQPRLGWALQDAIEQQGCPVCHVLRGSEEGFWHFFIYEAFQEPDAARAMEQSLGFCERHLHQLQARQDAFVTATMAAPALAAAAEALRSAGSGGGLLRPRSAPPHAGVGCPVCERIAKAAEEAVRVAGGLAEGGDREWALCYEHAALAAAEDVPGTDALVEATVRNLERRREQVQRFLDSFDHRAREAAATEDVEAVRAAWNDLRGDPGRTT